MKRDCPKRGETQVKKLASGIPDRLPPHDDGAEKAVSGSIILQPERVADVLKALPGPDAFYVLSNRQIFECMTELHGEGTVVDVITLTSKLKAKELLDRVGGPSFVSSLPDAIPSAANVSHYLAIVLEKYQRREAIRASQEAVESAFDEAKPFTAANGKLTSTPGDQLTPWEYPVNGAALLDTIAGEFRRFLVLPPHADTILALWTLHTYSWELCEYSPIIAITSPVKSCGKSRVLDVLEKLVRAPFRTGNMSEAVLFRVLDSRKPAVLVDEFDTIPDDRRDALSNILKHGFHVTGRVHRIEGEAKKEVVEFTVFGPKALACIKLSTLDAATISRCINIRMQRKRSNQKVDRLRRYDGTCFKRQCLRWTSDHHDRIEAATAIMPDTLGDREQDIYEPLFVLANLAGEDWPRRVEEAALSLCGETGDRAQDTPLQLLGWIRTYFEEAGEDKVSSAALVHWLSAREDAPFASWNDGKGINQHEIKRHMAGFNIAPEVIRLDDSKTARGYKVDWFKDAFQSYPPENPDSNCNSVTSPVNIGSTRGFDTVTEGGLLQLEKCVSTNKDGTCYDVTVSKPEPSTQEVKDALRL